MLIDADCHVIEPRDMWQSLGMYQLNVGVMFNGFTSPPASLGHSRTMDEFIPAEENYYKRYVYPTYGLYASSILAESPAYTVGFCAEYNQWALKKQTDVLRFGCLLPPVGHPENLLDAYPEFDFAVMLPNLNNVNNLISLFETLQDMNKPIAFHGVAGHALSVFQQGSAAELHALSAPLDMSITLVQLKINKIFDLFPKLRVGFIEVGCEWMQSTIYRILREQDSPVIGETFRSTSSNWISRIYETCNQHREHHDGVMYGTDEPHFDMNKQEEMRMSEDFKCYNARRFYEGA